MIDTDQSAHVGYCFLLEDFVPGVAVRVCGHDFGVGFLLDTSAFGGAEEGGRHVDVAGEGVEAGGDHRDANCLDLFVGHLSFRVLDDVACDAGDIGAVGHSFF